MFVATLEFLHEIESNMQTISSRAYDSLLANMWWRSVATERRSVSKKELLVWLISTARLRNVEPGNGHFEDMLMKETEIENDFATDGLILRKEQLEDVFNGMPGGEGLQMASRWASDIGAQIAYWPQEKVAHAILDGASAGFTSYDGLTFFNTAHFLNGVDDGDGTFSNILNPTTVGHATRIDDGVTLDAAMENLSAVRRYIATIKMPNGVQPRNLRMRAILHPTALRQRAVQLTASSIIAQAAASGGGSADVAAVIADWNLDQPLEATELGAAYSSEEGNSGSDTSYYIVAYQPGTEGDLGPLVYQTREDFGIVMNDGMTDAELRRAREIQWTTQGRNAVGYGHPYLLFQVNNS